MSIAAVAPRIPFQLSSELKVKPLTAEAAKVLA